MILIRFFQVGLLLRAKALMNCAVCLNHAVVLQSTYSCIFEIYSNETPFVRFWWSNFFDSGVGFMSFSLWRKGLHRCNGNSEVVSLKGRNLDLSIFECTRFVLRLVFFTVLKEVFGHGIISHHVMMKILDSKVGDSIGGIHQKNEQRIYGLFDLGVVLYQGSQWVFRVFRPIFSWFIFSLSPIFLTLSRSSSLRNAEDLKMHLRGQSHRPKRSQIFDDDRKERSGFFLYIKNTTNAAAFVTCVFEAGKPPPHLQATPHCKHPPIY